RLDTDLDIGVARRAALRAGHALALQPERLAIGGALGDVDVERLAIRQVDPLLAAARRDQERYPQRIGDGQPAHVVPVLPAPIGKAAAHAAPLAEHLGEDAAHVDEGFVRTGALVLGAAEAAALVAIEAARRHFLARRVDLAGVEATALLGVGQDVVGLRDFLEFGL